MAVEEFNRFLNYLRIEGTAIKSSAFELNLWFKFDKNRFI